MSINNPEASLRFGKKERVVDKTELIKRLYTLGGEEAKILDDFKEKMQPLAHGMLIGEIVDVDISLKETIYRDTITALADHGHTVTEKQLELFLESN